MTQALEEAKRMASNEFDEGQAIAWAIIAVAERLDETNRILQGLYDQTFNGINIFNSE